MEQLMRKNDELMVNSAITEYKLKVREKEDEIKELQKQLASAKEESSIFEEKHK